MNKNFSIYLDAVRVFAALVVLASHFGYQWASGGSLLWVRELNLGSDFVIVFFVLSGFVIAHTAKVKDKTLGNFATARLSRLYSVAIPAIIVSYLAMAIIASYPGSSAAARDIGAEIFAALTFTNYAWFGETRLPHNGPYWSVAYEFWYYALFGAWTFLKGRARLYSLAAIVLIIGMQVLLLLPCWLLGVFLYKRVTRSEGIRMTRAEAWLCALGPVVLYAFCLTFKIPLLLKYLTFLMLGGVHPYAALHFSDEFIWNTIIAALVAAHFLGVSSLIAQREVGAQITKVVRWWSARTFSLYLFHMPLLHIAAYHPAYDATNPAHVTGAAFFVIGGCLLLAEVTECRLGWWRRMAGSLQTSFKKRRQMAHASAIAR